MHILDEVSMKENESQHMAHVLSEEGDIVIKWNPDSRKDCAAAADLFETLLKEGYEAYATDQCSPLMSITGGSKYATHLISEFDEEIGQILVHKKVVLTPSQVQGGYPTAGMSEGRL